MTAGLVRAPWTRFAALGCSLGLYALLNATLAPLTGAAGHFGLTSLATGSRVAVPSSFNAQYERYQFLLPNAGRLDIAPYAVGRDPGQLTTLLQDHDLVLWQAPGDPCAQAAANCRVLSSRWDIRSRHQSGEIRLDNLLYPEQWLLRREWVLARP